MHLFAPTSWFLAFVWTVVAAASDNSGIVEVDLVFPRNETYAPTALVPVIFAFQNSHLAPALFPRITFSIWDWNNRSGEVLTTAYDVAWANFSSSDPYFAYRAFTRFNTEGTWQIRWAVSWFSCNEDSQVTSNTSNNAIIFTTKNSGQTVDLVAATNDKDCPKDLGVAVNVTDTLNATSIQDWQGREMCAVVAPSLATPDPCQVTIDSTVESSILASVTQQACEATDPVVDCPSEDESAAQKLAVGGVVCLAAALGAIFQLLV